METWWEDSSDFVVRCIPFYHGKLVQKTLGGGRLRSRGSRIGFVNPQSPKHKALDYGTYRMNKLQLAQSLPHHLSTEFTLYCTQGGRYKVYCDFQRIRKDGKIVLRLMKCFTG